MSDVQRDGVNEFRNQHEQFSWKNAKVAKYWSKTFVQLASCQEMHWIVKPEMVFFQKQSLKVDWNLNIRLNGYKLTLSY